MNLLDNLAERYGTDKGPKYHHYTKWYKQYFEMLRHDKITILELGWGGHEDPNKGGASAQMWSDYFPNGTVVCIDIEEKVITKAHDGINFRQGSQADPEFISQLVEEFGPFDIIIDDASHLSSLTIKSFELLWPHLRKNGLYFVEDTHGAYHEQFYGKDEANFDPDSPPVGDKTDQTMMQFLRRLADDVNFQGRGDNDLDLYPAKYWRGYDAEWVHFYFNLCAVKRRG